MADCRTIASDPFGALVANISRPQQCRRAASTRVAGASVLRVAATRVRAPVPSRSIMFSSFVSTPRSRDVNCGEKHDTPPHQHFFKRSEPTFSRFFGFAFSVLRNRSESSLSSSVGERPHFCIRFSVMSVQMRLMRVDGVFLFAKPQVGSIRGIALGKKSLF